MHKERERLSDLQHQAAHCTEKFCCVCGSPGTGKTHTLCARGLRLAREFGCENVLIISPHPVSAYNIVLRLKNHIPAPHPSVLYLFAFARKVVGNNWQQARYVSALGRFLILKKISHSTMFLSRLKRDRLLPGFVESLSHIVMMMREAGITSDSLRAYVGTGSTDNVLRDLAEVLFQYEKTLSKRHLTDKQHTIKEARKLIEKRSITLPRHLLIVCCLSVRWRFESVFSYWNRTSARS